MKLNLLPTYVSKGAKAKTVLAMSILFFVLSILGCVGLMVTSSGARDKARAEMNDARPPAEAAVRKAKEAEVVAAMGTELRRNVDLAAAMQKQNTKYTEFYSAITPYIPPYFRVNAMQVTPIDEKSCQLRLGGVIQSNQQYADIALAMLRIPGAVNVSREGFVVSDLFLPGVTEPDQRPIPHEFGKDRVPPLPKGGPAVGPDARLQYLIADAAANTPTGFSGEGGFGDPAVALRTAKKGFSDIVVNVVITGAAAAAPAAPGTVASTKPAPPALNVDFRTPVPRESLKGGAAAPAAAAAAAPGAPAPGAAPPGAARGRSGEDS